MPRTKKKPFSTTLAANRAALRHYAKLSGHDKDYERLKADWIAKHPEATPRQYEQAMTALARECGV